MHRVEEDMEAAKAAEDSAYAESLMLKSSMDMLTDQQQVCIFALHARFEHTHHVLTRLFPGRAAGRGE